MNHADLMNIVIAILPILLLLGAWAYFISKMRSQGGGYADNQKRIADALERIAKALEERR